jgi:lipopolysaccharide/colanic/teichoic acid biosynthesis glycosyltransferase
MQKRLFDLAFASVALVLLLPVLLALSLWVKFDSPGPVFFRQVRVGRYGAPFRIFKFRTMRVGSDWAGPQITIGKDVRITRSGQVLRKYKLDELPQFFNVILGEMSVVGPRPEVPIYVATYAPDLRDRVLSLRPGVTDLASIEYSDESAVLAKSEDPERTYVEVILPSKLRYALDYIATQNIWLDIRIVWRTAFSLLARDERS